MPPITNTTGLLAILYGICDIQHKTYCFASQQYLLKCLKERNVAERSRSTLTRWERILEDTKYIRRQRRSRPHRTLGHLFQSSLIFVLSKGWDTLILQNHPCWRQKAMAKKLESDIAKRELTRATGAAHIGAVVKPLATILLGDKADNEELKEALT